MRCEADDEFHELIEREPLLARQAARQLAQRLHDTGILFGNRVLPTSLKPHLMPVSVRDQFIADTSRLFAALERIGDVLFSDRDLQEQLSSRGEMRISRDGGWRLLEIDPGFGTSAVICRPDMLFTGGRLRLLELNSDSPAMMTFADRLQAIQRELFPMVQIEERWQLTYYWRTRALRDALMRCYREWGGSAEHPVVAVIDWPGQKTSHEQEHLARELTALGCPAFVCHPHELSISGGRLHGRGQPIDIVQRRLLFRDFLARPDDLAPLLRAYEDRMVCMINPLRSYFLGSKMFLSQLCTPFVQERLTPDERELVAQFLPHTFVVSPSSVAMLDDRTRWVLKPAHSCGGEGVIIGRNVTEKRWQECVAGAVTRSTVAQEFQPISRYRVPLAAPEGVDVVDLYANWNPFILDGRCAGDITRVSPNQVIGITTKGGLLPCVTVGARR